MYLLKGDYKYIITLNPKPQTPNPKPQTLNPYIYIYIYYSKSKTWSQDNSEVCSPQGKRPMEHSLGLRVEGFKGFQGFKGFRVEGFKGV